MASNVILFTCTLFFLQFLNIEVGNAQKYSYETPNMAGKFTRKELQMARPIIENAINIALNDAFKQSITSNNTSECTNAVKNSTGSAFSYFDAAGKLPAGFARGHTVWLGSFDTCQDIPDAHYCLLNFKIKINILPQVINEIFCGDSDVELGSADLIVEHENVSCQNASDGLPNNWSDEDGSDDDIGEAGTSNMGDGSNGNKDQSDEDGSDDDGSDEDGSDDDIGEAGTSNMGDGSDGNNDQSFVDKSEPIYPGSNVSRSQSLLLILSFLLRHKLTDVALGDLLLMLNALLPNAIPATKYKFYKSFKLEQSETIPLKLALCVPSVCGPVDLREWLASNSTKLHNSFEYVGSACPEKPSYTTDVVVTIVFCGFLLLLCLLGTTVDVFEWHSILKSPNESSSINHDQTSTTIRDEEIPFQASLQPYHKSTTDMSAPLVSEQARVPSVSSKIPAGVFVDFLRCFSLVRNATRIFSTNVPPKVITSINGLRVISMFWIILGHTFLFMLTSGLLANPVDLIADTSKLSLMVILNGYFSVDTFFFLSGLLLAYTCFRKLEKSEGKFNWFLFYFHRYVRLTPSLMFVILFYMKLNSFLAFSPLWTLQKDEQCSKYWWTNLIYINNFYPTRFTDECIGWTWYLANDMQFYIISPLVLILAYRFGRVGLLASAGSLFMASTISLASIYGYYNIDPTALSKWDLSNPFDKAKSDFSKMVYDKPYCRIQPYLIGMMLGYFMHKSYSGTRRPAWIVAVIAWLAAIAVGITLVYAPHEGIKKDGRHWTKTEKVFYGIFSKPAWSVALAWVVYACHYGLGGLIQRFLSARFWIPLSRLTYSAYLVHPIVLSFMFTSSNNSLYYSNKTITFNFITAVVLSYACAFILAVVIEFPCDNLENFAVNSFGKKKRAN